MLDEKLKRPAWGKGLSARLLALTIFFVMLSEVLIYVPSIARYRLVFLQERLAAAKLASFSLEATSDNMVSMELEKELLANTGLKGIVIKRPEKRTLMLSDKMPPKIDATFDLRDISALRLIADAFDTLRHGTRNIRVLDVLQGSPRGHVEVILSEHVLHAAMVKYSINILTLSIVISLITAALLFFSLHILMVRPMRLMTAGMAKFRRKPEDPANVITPSGRTDEVGLAEAELARMQGELRAALRQRAHLAALGTGVAKINHDLRNILATGQLISDRIAESEDPQVRRLAPSLVRAIDRAIDICTKTLNFSRAEELPPNRELFPLADLVDDLTLFLDPPKLSHITCDNQVPRGLLIDADRDQLFRIFMNLGRNAVQALNATKQETGVITISAFLRSSQVTIKFSDNGPGLPDQAREHLFEPFTVSTRSGGTGLGLVIARELAVAHGGNVELSNSDGAGCCFEITIPGGEIRLSEAG